MAFSAEEILEEFVEAAAPHAHVFAEDAQASRAEFSIIRRTGRSTKRNIGIPKGKHYWRAYFHQVIKADPAKLELQRKRSREAMRRFRAKQKASRESAATP